MAFQSTSINQHLFELSSVKVFFFFSVSSLSISLYMLLFKFLFFVLSITTKNGIYISPCIHELNILPCFYIAYMATRETHVCYLFFILNACQKFRCTYICFLTFRICICYTSAQMNFLFRIVFCFVVLYIDHLYF